MICSSCNGRVEWQGPLTNLTHTKCLNCGAINNQIVEDEPDDYSPICGNCPNPVKHDGDTCAECLQSEAEARRDDELESRYIVRQQVTEGKL